MSIAGKSNMDGCCVLCDAHCSARFTPRRRLDGYTVRMGLEFDAQEARTRAARQGWQHIPSPAPGRPALDFCPEHRREMTQ